MAAALTVWFGYPHAAWLPATPGLLPADVWDARLPPLLAAMGDLQAATGRLLHPSDPIAGAVVVALALSAAWVALQARLHRAAPIGAMAAALLALAAVTGPLMARQAGTPLGSSPLTLASAILLSVLVRRPGTPRSPATTAAVFVGLATVSVVASWFGAPRPTLTLALMAGDLTPAGLVLLAVAVSSRLPASVVGAGAGLWLVTLPLAPLPRAALLLPWAWWLVATGLATLLDWRGGASRRYAVVGLLGWIALGAAAVPWGLQRQQAALVRTWADGLVGIAGTGRPIVEERSARGRLVEALLRERSSAVGALPLLPLEAVPTAVRAGRRPIVLGQPDREFLRWHGVAVAPLPDGTGARLDSILASLPADTIVYAAIAADAAARLTPAEWPALGRAGLRLVDAGGPRAHVLVGLTGARVEALEGAREAATLDVLPGDALGRTGRRAPVDARLEAGPTRVSIRLRDRPFLEGRGLALAFFTTRGDLLGWRAGAISAALTGETLGAQPAAAAAAIGTLPCLDVEPGRATDLTPVVQAPALGITIAGAGRVEVRAERLADLQTRVSIDEGPWKDQAPVRYVVTPTVDGFVMETRDAGLVGVRLRGPVARASMTTTVPVRACAAWPGLAPIDVGPGVVEWPLTPDVEPYVDGGWHGLESLGDGKYFRWMAGPTATMLLPFTRVTPLRLRLDAQSVGTPGLTDAVRLSVNGHDLGSRPLLPTLGQYTWDVPVSSLRDGPNVIRLDTTLTMRPSDLQAGADGRRLGLAVHGWAFEATAEYPEAASSRNR